jgi:hypothetical protein
LAKANNNVVVFFFEKSTPNPCAFAVFALTFILSPHQNKYVNGLSLQKIINRKLSLEEKSIHVDKGSEIIFLLYFPGQKLYYHEVEFRLSNISKNSLITTGVFNTFSHSLEY